MRVILNGGEIEVGKALRSRQSKFRALKLERVTLQSPRKAKWQSWLGPIETYYYKSSIRYPASWTSSLWHCTSAFVSRVQHGIVVQISFTNFLCLLRRWWAPRPCSKRWLELQQTTKLAAFVSILMALNRSQVNWFHELPTYAKQRKLTFTK